jgi:hypothetical protein
VERRSRNVPDRSLCRVGLVVRPREVVDALERTSTRAVPGAVALFFEIGGRGDFDTSDITMNHMMLAAVVRPTQPPSPDVWRYFAMIVDGLASNRSATPTPTAPPLR